MMGRAGCRQGTVASQENLQDFLILLIDILTSPQALKSALIRTVCVQKDGNSFDGWALLAGESLWLAKTSIRV